MEQKHLFQAAFVQLLQPQAGFRNRHVGIPDPVPYLLRHPLRPLQDVLGVVALNGRHGHPGELIPQIYRVRGEHQLVSVPLAADQEPHGLRRVVEGGKGEDLEGADLHRLPVLQNLHPVPLQGLRRPRAGIHRDSALVELIIAARMVLVLMGDQAGRRLGHGKSHQLLQFFVRNPAFDQQEGLSVLQHIGISVGGRGQWMKSQMGHSSLVAAAV